ncbi:MAG: hypothetical protein WCX17_03895 [Parcubacteria group bacterium]|jgi:hypothetical protein
MGKQVVVIVFSRIDKMLPSEYAKLFYAECARRGAKFICLCGHEEDWQNREYETMHCNCPDMNCSGVMVLTINGEEAEKEVKPEVEKKVCPGGRKEIRTGRIMVVDVSEDTGCAQARDCRFFKNCEGFLCRYYKPKEGK